jgi:tRNA(Ile)-lysidine synthetase-like protein
MPVQVRQTQTPYGTVNVSATMPNQPSLMLDFDKLPPTAVVRTPQPGDVFTKFGGGTKPLVRYLIDKKIPQRQRNKLLLVADGNNVLMVCGVEIADAVKTDDNTKQKYYVYLT